MYYPHNRQGFIFISVVVLALFHGKPLGADTIILKSGEKIQGQIVKKERFFYRIESDYPRKLLNPDEIKEVVPAVIAAAPSSSGADQTQSISQPPPDKTEDPPVSEHLREEWEAVKNDLTPKKAMITREDFIGVTLHKDGNQSLLVTQTVRKELEKEMNYVNKNIYFIRDPETKTLKLFGLDINVRSVTRKVASTGETLSEEDILRAYEKQAKDTDGDGLTDEEENCELGQPNCIKTDPTKRDTDGDGWWDSIERIAGTDPLDPASHPFGQSSALPGSSKTATIAQTA
jgi:hypothetical protein